MPYIECDQLLGPPLAASDPMSALQSVHPSNGVVREAHEGCYIALFKGDLENPCLPDWVLGVDICEDEDGDGLPDMTIDPDEGTFTLLNSSGVGRSYFVTVGKCSAVYGSSGEDLLLDPLSGGRRELITFIAYLPPSTCMDLVNLVPIGGLSKRKKKNGKSAKKKTYDFSTIEIFSDVQDCTRFDEAPTDPLETYDLDVFPLERGPSGGSSWLCTQSEGGALTHFAHPSTYYAVDFRCPVGTPVIAIFDGEVLEVKGDSALTGVHVFNLFSWNSVLIKKIDDDLYAEYVHIHREGIAVAVGDKVRKGQVICLSGDAGFCPEPHLHIQLNRGREVSAPSVPITFRGSRIVAGAHYPPSTDISELTDI